MDSRQNQSGVHTDAKSSSQIQTYTLDSPEIKDILVLFHEVVSTCYGPHGNIKMIQNCVGGHLTLTSSSLRILNTMSISKPVLRLITNAVQGHLKRFHDGGLFIMCFTLNLILGSTKLDINRIHLVSLYEIFLQEIVLFLMQSSSASSKFKYKIKVSDVDCMRSVINTILTSKPLCNLSNENIQHLCKIMLEMFLITINDTVRHYKTDRQLFIAFENKSALSSKLYKGVLLQSPEIPIFNEQSFNWSQSKDGILIAMVTVSMSGDTEELGDVLHESDGSIDHLTTLLKTIENFCAMLKKLDVGILLCQKVIHPRIKRQLKHLEILYVERIGLQMVGYVTDVSGAVPICHFHSMNKEQLGKVDSAHHIILDGKSYLHLIPVCAPVGSIVLYSQHAEELEELKVVCKTVLYTLNHLLYDSTVVLGGGCWQYATAQFLKQQIITKMEEIYNSTKIPKSKISSACEVFCDSLIRMSKSCHGENKQYLSHPTMPHLWSVSNGDNCDIETSTCGCGSHCKPLSDLQPIPIKTGKENTAKYKFDQTAEDQEILNLPPNTDLKVDLLINCVNALKTSIYTANTVLSIGQYICDVN